MNRIFRMNAFVRYFLSYIAVLSVIMGISIVVYTIVEDELKNQLSINNMSNLHKSQVFVEERLKSIEQVASEIALNPKVQSYLQISDKNDVRTIYATYDIERDLSRYCSINSYFDSIYVIFNSSDTVIGGNGAYNRAFFSKEVLGGVAAEELSHAMKEPTSGRFISADGKTGSKTRVFVLSLPFWDKAQVLGTVLIVVNEEQILGTRNAEEAGTEDYSVVLDERGEVIAETGDGQQYRTILADAFRKKKDETPAGQLDGTRLLVSYSQSRYHKWFFVTITSMNVAFSKLYALRVIGINATVIAVLAGLLLSIVLARMNYLPIKRIIKKYREKDFGKDGNVNLAFLEEAFNETLEQYKSVRSIIARQAPLMKENILIQMIQGSYGDREHLDSSLKQHGIEFPGRYFFVLSAEFEDKGTFIRENHPQDYVLAQFVLSNILEEILSSCGLVYSIMTDKTARCFLINTDEALENPVESLRDKLMEGVGVIREQFDIRVHLGISGCGAELDAIAALWREAVEAGEHLRFYDQDGILFFSELDKLQSSYYYPMELQVKISNSIKIGNQEQTLLTLKSIYDMNLKERNLTINSFKCLHFGILNTILQTLNELKITNEVSKPYFERVSELATSASVHDLYGTTAEAVLDLCREVGKKKKSRNEELKDEILDFIHVNYRDNRVSLDYISQAININPSYLSSFFKEQTGENVSDYINKLRVEYIKKLLVETDFPLSSIAQSSGYTNASILIRAFRKNEGITPGQYREAGKPANSQ